MPTGRKRIDAAFEPSSTWRGRARQVRWWTFQPAEAIAARPSAETVTCWTNWGHTWSCATKLKWGSWHRLQYTSRGAAAVVEAAADVGTSRQEASGSAETCGCSHNLPVTRPAISSHRAAREWSSWRMLHGLGPPVTYSPCGGCANFFRCRICGDGCSKQGQLASRRKIQRRRLVYLVTRGSLKCYIGIIIY